MSAMRTVTEQLPLADDPPQWYAFRTMFKREKMVAKRLNTKGIEAYVPLRTVVRHYKSKTKTLEIPLFSSYVFIRLTAKHYPIVLLDDDVFEVVKFQGEVGRVTDAEIDFLKRILRDSSNDYEVEIYDGLLPGTPIVLSGGTLAGTKGKIVEQQGNKRFVVELQTLGVSLTLTVDQKHFSTDPQLSGVSNE